MHIIKGIVLNDSRQVHGNSDTPVYIITLSKL